MSNSGLDVILSHYPYFTSVLLMVAKLPISYAVEASTFTQQKLISCGNWLTHYQFIPRHFVYGNLSAA